MDIQQLMTIPLFREMSGPELDFLTEIIHEKAMEVGSAVFIENMPGESLYIVKTGKVQISKMISEGEEKPLVEMGPNEFFGEMAILDGAPRSATARVLEAGTFMTIHKADFESFCDHHPRVGLKLMRNIVQMFSRRIRENNQEYRDMLLWAMGKNT